MAAIQTERYTLENMDCMEYMKEMCDNSVNLTLTDIPYDAVNRSSNGLRELDKGKADIITFDLEQFLESILRISSSTAIVFCGKEQFSFIYGFFARQKGTVRPIVWEKTNPSPMNGQYIYLSGVELAVWFKKAGGTFNAHCKNTVFRFPNGRNSIHPTQKNEKLMAELILDSSNENDLVFDPCFGGGTTAVACLKTNRRFLGCELDEVYFNAAAERIADAGKTAV